MNEWTFIQDIDFAGSSAQIDSTAFSTPATGFMYKVEFTVKNDHSAGNNVRLWLNQLTGSIHDYVTVTGQGSFAGIQNNNANGILVVSFLNQGDTATGEIIFGNKLSSSTTLGDRIALKGNIGSNRASTPTLYFGSVNINPDTDIEKIGFSAQSGNITGKFRIFRQDV